MTGGVARAFLVLIGLVAGAAPALAAFVGHGGPVRALALTADGETLVSGSFDYSVILWRLADGAATDVLHGHDAAVNAVALLPDGSGFVTAGDDAAVLVWRFGERVPVRRLSGHTGRVVALDIAPDGRRVASASWDRTARVWDVETGAELLRLEGAANVDAVRFTGDGATIVTAGADGAIRLWRAADGTALAVLGGGPVGLNGLVLGPEGLAYAAGADGAVAVFDLAAGVRQGTLATGIRAPLLALAISPDGKLLAAAGMAGPITLFDLKSGEIAAVLAGERQPLWALAFAPDGGILYAGGNDRTIRQFSVADWVEIEAPASLPPLEVATTNGEAGALAWRRCEACHTLTPDGGNRAGPTLHRIFGRRIGTAPGYPYSPALASGDLVWTEETVARLFALGPDVVTPGTKMPIQRILDAAERAALIGFLRREAMGGE